MLLTVLLWLLAAIVVACLAVVGYFVFRTRRIVAWVERTMPPAGKFIDIKGNRIHYVDVGEGPPIVFLHGLGAQLHHFTHPLFKVFGPGYRLIALTARVPVIRHAHGVRPAGCRNRRISSAPSWKDWASKNL